MATYYSLPQVLSQQNFKTCSIKYFLFFLFEFLQSIFAYFSDDDLNSKMTTTKTLRKKGPSPEVQEIMKKHLELEYDFYNFVKQRFQRLKAELS